VFSSSNPSWLSSIKRWLPLLVDQFFPIYRKYFQSGLSFKLFLQQFFFFGSSLVLKGMRTDQMLFLLEIEPGIPQVCPWKELLAAEAQTTYQFNTREFLEAINVFLNTLYHLVIILDHLNRCQSNNFEEKKYIDEMWKPYYECTPISKPTPHFTPHLMRIVINY
jgi:hypothetical protein